MPTVIDSLVLELGLDPSKFTKGQKDALASLRELNDRALKTGKDVESTSKKTAAFFQNLKTQVIGVFGGYEIAKFVSNLSTADAALGRSAKMMDISARELASWQGAARATGGSAEGITASLEGMSGAINTFVLTGQGSFLPLFNNLGISLYDQNKQLKTSTQLFLDLNKAVQGMDPARARALLSMAPGMSQDMLNLLMLAPKQLQEIIDKQKRLNNVTPTSVKEMQDFQEQVGHLTTALEALGRAITRWFIGPLTTVIEILTELFNWNVDLWGTKGGKGGDDMRKKIDAAKTELRGGGGGAGSSALTGKKLTTITTPGGRKVTVAASAAGDFQGFLSDLERSGAPIGSLGGYNYRKIAGTNTWSEHAKGLAIDMGSMSGRDQIDPALRAWISAHPNEWRTLLARYNIKSGGDFKNPDLGHIEWSGARAAASARQVNNAWSNVGDTNSATTMTIQEININAPKANDGPSIAATIGQSLRQTVPFNFGQQG